MREKFTMLHKTIIVRCHGHYPLPNATPLKNADRSFLTRLTNLRGTKHKPLIGFVNLLCQVIFPLALTTRPHLSWPITTCLSLLSQVRNEWRALLCHFPIKDSRCTQVLHSFQTQCSFKADRNRCKGFYDGRISRAAVMGIPRRHSEHLIEYFRIQ